MRRFIYAIFAVSALSVAAAVAVHAQDYKKAVIYQVVTDRFYDGSTSNDNLPRVRGCMTPTALPKIKAEIAPPTGKRTGAAT